MKLYLVKSDIVKARYFFADEAKAKAFYKALLEEHCDLEGGSDHIQFKYLKTSDEWSVEQLLQHFDQVRESK
jgi:hypothetical protein